MLDPLLLLLSTIALVDAVWDISYWNTSAGASCPGLGFGCTAPLQWCSHNNPLDKYYCCDVTDDVCWSGSDAFQGNSNGNLSSILQTCGDSQATYYCLNSDYESCTARSNQFNICWSKDVSPVAVQYEKQLNDTFSSLSSAQPQATSITFNVAAMLATVTVTSSSSTASSSTSTTSPSSTIISATTPISTNTNTPSSSGVSGGAIAGGVVGAIAGVALIAAGIILFLRRRRSNNNNNNVAPVETSHYEPKLEPWQSPDPQELPYNEYLGHFAPTKEPLLGIQQQPQQHHAELPAHVAPVELPNAR